METFDSVENVGAFAPTGSKKGTTVVNISKPILYNPCENVGMLGYIKMCKYLT